MKRYILHIWLCFFTVAFTAAEGSLFAGVGIAAITDPSADVTLSFLTSGRIAQVVAKDGDVIKQGQLLIRQDDTVEQAQLEKLRAESEDTTQILAAQATMEQKKIDLKRLDWAAQRGAATDLEVQHAKLDVRIAELSLKVAEFEHSQSIRTYEAARISIENMKLQSPVSGTVEQVLVEVGESVNSLAEIIRVVKTDPLWIDAPVPLRLARNLKINNTAVIRLTDSPDETMQGKVIFISTAADAASNTLRVRIEVPNKTSRPSGEHVIVNFGGNSNQQRTQHEDSASIPQRYTRK